MADVAQLLRRHDRPGPRYTSYPTALEFTEAFDEGAYVDALARAAASPKEPLSLYVHLPFCAERCLYCACNVVVTRHAEPAGRYLERLEREIAIVTHHLGDRRGVAQLHLGGGTPTYFSPERLTHLFARLREAFTMLPNAEIAVEVDPRVTTEAHLEALAAAGVNRLSFGVQDFEPLVQRTIHREQSVGATHASMRFARTLGVGSINLDLIYGLPHQTATTMERTLEHVIGLRPERMAIYSFAYVPWMHAHQKHLPQEAMPTGDEKLELLLLARERLTQAGYLDVGMDHFALPDDELCVAQAEGRLWRNFMGYTTARAPEMVAFGMSGIGEVGGAYVQNEKKLNRYLDAIDAGRLPVARGWRLSDDDRVRQHLIREWMCHFRVSRSDVASRFAIDFDDTFAAELEDLAALAREGLIQFGDDGFVATELGRMLPRNVAMVFDRYTRARAGEARFSRTV
ncbi:MAG: oxygen-independent coproporphyrinogen III oxidase [Trueperaceae bacterium]